MYGKTLHTLFLLAVITTIASHTTCPNTEDITELHRRVKQSCTKSVNPNVPHCPPDVDLLFTCWGPVPANTTATLPCPTKFPLPSGNISRACRSNGQWEFPNTILHCPMVVPQERIADLVKEYKICEPDPTYPEWIDLNRNLDAILRIIDAIVVFFGFVVLLILIPLKEDRIMLHRNLLAAFFLSDIQEIIQSQDMSITACSITYVFGLYFILAEICWMFNEGFYQFRAFYFVFITKKHKWAYFLFGWGFPALIVFVIYFPLMYHDPFTHSLLEKDPPFNYCWKNTKRYKYNYIVWGVGVAILLINLSITIYILRIVISKLQSQDISEIQKAKKVSRGFFLLIILLGGGYMVTVYGPEDNLKFEAFRIIITSFQGILITVFHVLLSREVIDSGKKKLRKFLVKHNIDSRFLTNTSSMKSSTEVYQSYNKRFSIFDRKSSTTSTLRINFFDRKSSNSSNSMPRVSVCSVDINSGQGKSEITAIPEHCEDENKNKTEECDKGKELKQNCVLEETSSNNYDDNEFFGETNKMFSTDQVPGDKDQDEGESCTDINTISDGQDQKIASKEKLSVGGEDSITIDRNVDTDIGNKNKEERDQDGKVNYVGIYRSDKLLDDENKATKSLNSCQSESNFTKENEIANKKNMDSITKNSTGSIDISMDSEGISNEGFSDC